MKLWLILLFLQLWEYLEVSSQNACSKAPAVPHAHVSEETKKAEYHQGNVINFECDSGYTSDQSSQFVCTSRGWHVVRQGTCFSCSKLPDVPHAQVSEQSQKAEYQVGDVIHFSCEPAYTSDVIINYICVNEGWLPVHQGSCYIPASGCDRPPAVGGLIIEGFPDNNSPIPPNHVLIFSCDDPGKHLDGSSVGICGKDGQWSNPVPSCRENTCEIGVIHPHLFVAGLPPTGQSIKAGHTLRFQCSGNFPLKGSEEIQCLQSGQWNSPFPTCTGTAGCSGPPPLDGGDIKESLKPLYRHNERVEYLCMSFHKMEGGPHITCVDGQWIGQIKCLKPCTVDSHHMEANNIQMIRHYSKLYSEHGDHIAFECKRGTYRVGPESLRQRCENGVMILPKCQ
ncbi:complement factor H-related protein 2-like [Odontesthes bonariensis]|uniref:complement factor H-related protein 2-like n=1 Tax=Odontesthes bonariensis TaxID=219752 RepID=UPI003F5855A8